MCGLVGVFCHAPSVREHAGLMPALIELMARRGPDGAGQWTDGEHLALGFRRLAVLDLSPAADQPMVGAGGRFVLAYNGEVYNFAELRRHLEAKGHAFRTRSDTEVVLTALAAWGPDALGRFDGMFALALYDRTERALLLARDPMGVKPLYYLDHSKGVVFGSQYDQLLAHPWCDRSAVREDVLGLYLRLGYVPPPYGLLAGTHQLEPGTSVVVRPGARPVATRYADQTGPAELAGASLTGPAAADAVGAAVAGSVRAQMVSDVPVGAFLSGGVDSPLVAANMVAANMVAGTGGRVPAFTIGSTDPAADESAVAATYARHLGLDHHVRVFDARDCLGLLDDMAAAYSEPFADHSALPTMLVSSMAADQVTVALSGDGGDELFWGYPRFRKVLGARRWFALPRALRAAAYGAGKLAPGLRPPRGVVAPSLGDWCLDAHSGLRPADLHRLRPGGFPLPTGFDLYDTSGLGGLGAVAGRQFRPAQFRPAQFRLAQFQLAQFQLAQWLRANELRGHLQMVLLKVDRASMFYGLEVRVPFLGRSVVEQAMALHPDACMSPGVGPGVGKVVLRDVLGGFVPPASIPVDKRGFDVPVGRFLRDELAPRVRAALVERDPFPSGLFDRPAVRAFVEGHIGGSTDRAQGVWNLFALQLWADTHLRAPSAVLR